MPEVTHGFSTRVNATATAILLLGGVTACAAEPEAVSGTTDKETEITNPETEWSGTDAVPYEPRAELPPTFPSEAFALPAELHIYDAGERAQDEWFLVLIAEDSAAAETLWQTIVTESSFEVVDKLDTVEGGISATLHNAHLTVTLLTIPQPDASVWLSFDLLRNVV